MKARVKATGEIVEVKSKVITSLSTGRPLLKYVGQKTGISYFEEELFFPKDLVDDPDYWTRLEHQYAGMAMQTMLTTLYNPKYHKELMACYTEVDAEEVARLSKYYAHVLVEKLKLEEKK